MLLAGSRKAPYRAPLAPIKTPCRSALKPRTASICHLVAPDRPVVAEHHGHGDRQADGGHDQRLTDRACNLVDRGLARDANRGQRVVDAPDSAEEPTNGAVEPTVARNARPSCRRLCTIARLEHAKKPARTAGGLHSGSAKVRTCSSLRWSRTGQPDRRTACCTLHWSRLFRHRTRAPG